MCPLPNVSERCAMHVACPSGYMLHSYVVNGKLLVPLAKILFLDESSTGYQILYCPTTQPSRVVWVPKCGVCLKYPIVVSYSDDAELITFQYRIVSLTSTRALGFNFKVDGKY
jgi:hypothetical protein